jgi:predicted ATPase/DNA-binding XRE family transcriptional regulator
MPTGPLTLGEWMKRRRRALDLTQEKLARQVPCSVVTIQKIEGGGRRPSREFARRLAECLDIPPEQHAEWISFARAETGSAEQRVAAQMFRPPANLPLPPTPLIGREGEVAAVRRRLGRESVRLLTLLGPPGIGKTRLALQVAAELRDDFQDGTYFVDLAPISDPDLVGPAIAGTLGLRPAGARSLLPQLLAYLQDKQLLLLLDNFEQLVAAASMVASLLAASPWLKVLATSRVALRVRGERQFTVPPLALPDLAQLPPVRSLVRCPSVALFVDRSQAVDPSFRVTEADAGAVAAVCCRLDGLPLAIELIAARTKILPPEALLSRLSGRLLLHTDGLSDVPDRQRTLGAAIGWSYDLLHDREKAALKSLSVFRGGWTLEGAEALVGADPFPAVGTIDQVAVLDLLASLVDKSLIQRRNVDGEPRFSMLETVREYALAKLREGGQEEAVRDTHAVFCLALAESAGPHLTEAGALRWLDRLEREHDNLRAALHWTLDSGQVKLVLRLGGALFRFWRKRGYPAEGLRWLETALQLDDTVAAGRTGERTSARAKALLGAGALARALGQFSRAKVLHAESLALYELMGDEPGMALALYVSGADAHDLGDLASARALWEESLALYRAARDERGLALVLGMFGQLAEAEGDLAQAERIYTEFLQRHTGRGETYAIAWALLNLGNLARLRGAYSRGMDLLGESLGLFRTMGDQETAAMVLHRLGELAWAQGDLARADVYLAESLALSRETECRTEAAEALRILGRLALAQGEIGRAGDLCAQSVALFREIGESPDCLRALCDLGQVTLCQGDLVGAAALFRESLAGLERIAVRVGVPACLEGLSAVWQADGRLAAAARLLAAAATMREAMGTPLSTILREPYEGGVAELRAALGEGGFAAAWAEGQAMSWSDAVVLALGDSTAIP